MEMIMSTKLNAIARRNSAGGNILGMLVAAPKRLWAAIITLRIQQAAVVRLRSMTDRELEDIGLSRSQIEGAVTGEHGRDHVFCRYC
jgi:uncharacterized protein YjiS (DUF1127 family)